MTHATVQQSNKVTLVIDEYSNALLTAQPSSIVINKTDLFPSDYVISVRRWINEIKNSTIHNFIVTKLSKFFLSES